MGGAELGSARWEMEMGVGHVGDMELSCGRWVCLSTVGTGLGTWVLGERSEALAQDQCTILLRG